MGGDITFKKVPFFKTVLILVCVEVSVGELIINLKTSQCIGLNPCLCGS